MHLPDDEEAWEVRVYSISRFGVGFTSTEPFFARQRASFADWPRPGEAIASDSNRRVPQIRCGNLCHRRGICGIFQPAIWPVPGKIP